MEEVKKYVLYVIVTDRCDEDELCNALNNAVYSCKGAYLCGYTEEYDLIDVTDDLIAGRE